MILEGDCIELMRELVAEKVVVQSILTDPPYGISFMSAKWDGPDGIAFHTEIWKLCYELLPPGGHLLAFGGTRTYHRLVCAIEDAGFEIRDTLSWIYGTGFPKSLSVSKAIDRQLGASREVIGREFLSNDIRSAGLLDAAHGERPGYSRDVSVATSDEAKEWDGYGTALKPAHEMICLARKNELYTTGGYGGGIGRKEVAMRNPNVRDPVKNAEHLERWQQGYGGNADITAPASPEAQQWDGYGTALKPSQELVCLARKPLDGTVAQNVLKHGVGGLNIDGCRIGCDDKTVFPEGITSYRGDIISAMSSNPRPGDEHPEGRWPANVIHDGSDEVLETFAAFGEKPTGALKPHLENHTNITSSAARFFKNCEYNTEEVVFSRAKSILYQWNPDLANTADNIINLPRKVVDFALSDVVTWVSRGENALYQIDKSLEPFTTVTPIELKRISEAVIVVILSLEDGSLPEPQHEKHILNGCRVKCAEATKQTAITKITISHWKSDGSVANVIFSITPTNSEVGEKDLNANRFMYCAKASKAERRGSKHPTVKPVALMRWLVRMITPPNGIVLDPFAGTGTTGEAAVLEGFDYLLIERDAESILDIKRRCAQ